MPVESSASQVKPFKIVCPIIAQFPSNTIHVSELRKVIFLIQNVVVELLISVVKFFKSATCFRQKYLLFSCCPILPISNHAYLLGNSNALKVH